MKIRKNDFKLRVTTNYLRKLQIQTKNGVEIFDDAIDAFQNEHPDDGGKEASK